VGRAEEVATGVREEVTVAMADEEGRGAAVALAGELEGSRVVHRALLTAAEQDGGGKPPGRICAAAQVGSCRQICKSSPGTRRPEKPQR
jgi:hypothetical protein